MFEKLKWCIRMMFPKYRRWTYEYFAFGIDDLMSLEEYLDRRKRKG